VPQLQPLFRHEALEFQRGTGRFGEITPLQAPTTRLVAWFLIATVALLVAFLFLAQYSRKETVTGYLAPTTGTARVFAGQPGTIRAVHVRQGDLVSEGQPLLTVETDRVAANGADINASMLTTLGSERESLARNISAEQDRAGSERRRLTALAQGLETEGRELEGQIAIQAQRIRVAQDEVASADQLTARGYMPVVEQKRRLSNLLEQKQSLNALRAQAAERRNQLIETRFALEQLPTTTAQKIQGLHTQLAGTEEKIAEVEGRRAYVLRAPASGRVATLQATPGQSVDPRRVQLVIVPSAATLQAELFVPTRAIAFIRPGQTVRLRYDAFPYQHFGAYRGRITKVSQTIVTAADVAGPVNLAEPAYRVTAALERPDVDAYGARAPLQPDMLLKADIVLDRRPLVQWLVDPLLRGRRRS
jgi:membrane fusion protein